MKKKVTLQDVKEFLNFRACAEKFRIVFSYWVKPGGVYIVEANEVQLSEIGY